jgi:Golgi phosphoprotein 3
MFTLPEELLLLSIHEVKGTIVDSAMERLKPGLAGAILAELALAGKIQSNPNHRLQLVGDSQVQDEILIKVIEALKEAGKERKFGYWIETLGQKAEKYQGKISESLILKGVFTKEDERLQWVIPSPLQPEVKASTKYLVSRRLRGIALAQEPFEIRDLVLLSLVNTCDLLDLVFLRDERKLAARYITEQLFSRAISDPAIQTVQEIEAAVAAAVEED